MERKLGEVFTCNGKLYQVVKGFSCNGCAFIKNGNCYLDYKFLGPCAYTKRTDRTSVIFKLINNMEIKNNQLTIDIPEGMEIDVEHSDLSKGIIKFRNNNITLEDIYEDDNIDYAANLVILSENKLFNKLLCIARLIDIANYYNKGWKPDFNNKTTYKYVIQYNGIENKHTHYSVDYDVCLNRCCIYFKNQEDAQAVIDNPNFRDILDAIYKD